MPRRFWPPSQSGGPPGVRGGGSLVASASGIERVRAGHAGWGGSLCGPHRAERRGPRTRTGRIARASAGMGIPNGRCSRLVPAGAQTHDEPAAGGVVHDRRGLGQDRRVAERGRRARRDPATCPGRGGRAPPSRSALPRLGPCALVRDVGQVVVHPDRRRTPRARRCAPRRHSRVGQSTACGDVLIPIGTGRVIPRCSPCARYGRSAAGRQVRAHARPGRDRTLRSRPDERRVLGQDATRVVAAAAASSA